MKETEQTDHAWLISAGARAHTHIPPHTDISQPILILIQHAERMLSSSAAAAASTASTSIPAISDAAALHQQFST